MAAEKAEMVLHETGDEEIAVIVAFAPVDLDVGADLLRGLLEPMRMQLLVEEVVRQTLLHPDRRQRLGYRIHRDEDQILVGGERSCPSAETRGPTLPSVCDK